MESLPVDRWVQAQLPQTVNAWKRAATPWKRPSRRYTPAEQTVREEAFDRALREVRRETRTAALAPAPRRTEQRLVSSFARFAAAAFDLNDDAIALLTRQFLPVGTQLARWARAFDNSLTTADIVQACRNAWTACGLQPMLGAPMHLTPAILAYSLLYPYSDNFLDRETCSREQKLRFSERFRCRLRGELLFPHDRHEQSVWTMVALIEGQFPRDRHPAVFESLLAIHRAQEQSLAQHGSLGRFTADELLRISCDKGGTSVLADAFLVRGFLSESESRFAFDWGVLLQLGDDLQDVREDLESGSDTLFTRAVRSGHPLDALVSQLLNFSDVVAARMDSLSRADATHNALLRMSWRSLILMAVAQSHASFSAAFLAELEPHSPFRFAFLRARRQTLHGDSGLIENLFQILLRGKGPASFVKLRRVPVNSRPADNAPDLSPAPALSFLPG